MSPLSQDKLVSFLAEIQSDIRQIKSDLQSLVMLLKQLAAVPLRRQPRRRFPVMAQSGHPTTVGVMQILLCYKN